LADTPPEAASVDAIMSIEGHMFVDAGVASPEIARTLCLGERRVTVATEKLRDAALPTLESDDRPLFEPGGLETIVHQPSSSRDAQQVVLYRTLVWCAGAFAPGSVRPSRPDGRVPPAAIAYEKSSRFREILNVRGRRRSVGVIRRNLPVLA